MSSIMSTQGQAVKAIHIQVPVGIPTADGGLEIPNRVFLGGIPAETTELELELFFSDYGVVKDVRIVTDRVTGECKGYGFVTFDENEDIEAMVRKKTINMKGKKLRIRKAVRRNGSQFNCPSETSSNCGSLSPSETLNSDLLFVQHSQPPPQPQQTSQLVYTTSSPMIQPVMAPTQMMLPSQNQMMLPSQNQMMLPSQNQMMQPVYYVPCMPQQHHLPIPCPFY